MRKKKTSIAAVVAVLLFLGALEIAGGTFFLLKAKDVLGFGFDTQEVDLVYGIDAADVVFTGIDGDGNAYVQGDAILAGLDYDRTSESMSEFLGTVTYRIEPADGLSNHDSVLIIADYDEELARKLRITVTDNRFEMEVEGLEDPSDKIDDEDDPDDADDQDSDDEKDDPDDEDDEKDDSDDEDYIVMTVRASDNYAAVREGRGTQFKEVGRITNGHKVKLTDLENGWYKIAGGKYKGYYTHQSSFVSE